MNPKDLVNGVCVFISILNRKDYQWRIGTAVNGKVHYLSLIFSKIFDTTDSFNFVCQSYKANMA